ncbi:MAG: alpha/beta fold hydrolase [Bryobacteraceae bacterium]
MRLPKPPKHPPFEPLFRSGHISTLAANFWTRPESVDRWPVEDVYYEPEPGIKILVRVQSPEKPVGELILVHGLEGSSESGYARSMAAAALAAGFRTHRYNMRGCGASPWSPRGNYHSGLTSDLLMVARERRKVSGLPIFAVGYSLGGNMVLKLAGELGEHAHEVFESVCAVSTPIDLGASVDDTERPSNIIYRKRFVNRLKLRVKRRNSIAPDLFPLEPLPKVKTIRDFDEHYTSRIFGFGSAENYYRTQSSNQFLQHIRIPTLVVQAKNDPMIPFKIYDHPAFRENPHLHLIAVEHGGHLGFLARGKARFWLDHVIVDWLKAHMPEMAATPDVP